MATYTLRAAVLGLSVLLAGSSFVPAEAVPIPERQATHNQTDVQVVRDRNDRIWRRDRGGRTWHNRGFRNYHTWRGHRGYRYWRPGYRRYGGWWYPRAAFGVGVVIRPGVRVGGNAHVRWCRNHYVSYRRADNTFQPYNGPRRQCISPYSR